MGKAGRPYLSPGKKTVLVSLKVPEDLKEAMASYADDRGISVSALLRMAVLAEMRVGITSDGCQGCGGEIAGVLGGGLWCCVCGRRAGPSGGF